MVIYMKKVIILGTGAQGSFIAKLLNNEPHVSEIVCADINVEAAQRVAESLGKARGIRVDASDVGAILEASKGMDILVNAIIPELNHVVMEAALDGKMHYLDMASPNVDGVNYVDGVDCLKRQFAFGDKFKEAGLVALICAGSAPGTSNVIAMNAADKLDSCERIDFLFCENNWPKRFTPFWWAPETALNDMVEEPVVFEDGGFKTVLPFSGEEIVDLKGIGAYRLVNHAHEEPVTIGMAVKGLKESHFKYGGRMVEIAEHLYKLRLLGKDPVDVNGAEIVPFDVVVKLCPPAPSTTGEVRAILDEGFDETGAAALIRVEGQKDGKHCRYDCYMNSPGIAEAFEKFGVSGEVYVTATSGALFTKLLVLDKIETGGVYSTEMLDADVRQFFIEEAAKMGITVEEAFEQFE
jgi:saccharopine dehydrogenase (NAD+, L-lysine-forming)